jgi:hypothetical protein
MALVMKKNKALNPVAISLLGPNAVVFAANYVSHLIEQFRLVRI